MNTTTVDWIHKRIIDRAKELGWTPDGSGTLTSYMIATKTGWNYRTGGGVGENHVRDFLNGQCSMTTRRLHLILTALGLDIVARK